MKSYTFHQLLIEKDVFFMKYIIFAIILTITYILLFSLMKAASKSTPSMPLIKYKGDKYN